MSEIDYVIPKIKIEEEGTFDLGELLRLLRSYFTKHGYDFYEKEYIDKQGLSNSIKWACEKKVDDYVKFFIEIRIKGKDLKKISMNKKNMFKGKVSLGFEAYFKKDYDDKFVTNPSVKFMRTLYDRFFFGVKWKRYEKELTEETYDIYNKAKAFLRLEGYK